jgi:hypothetical protein
MSAFCLRRATYAERWHTMVAMVHWPFPGPDSLTGGRAVTGHTALTGANRATGEPHPERQYDCLFFRPFRHHIGREGKIHEQHCRLPGYGIVVPTAREGGP